jgi:MFS family permease
MKNRFRTLSLRQLSEKNPTTIFQMEEQQHGLSSLGPGAHRSVALAGSTVRVTPFHPIAAFVSNSLLLCPPGVGIFQDYYQHELLSSYSSSTIAWIPSLQIFFMFASGPLIGKLHDRYGPHYLIFCGTVLHVFGLMMASISKEYYQILLSQGVCSAIGASAIFQPGMALNLDQHEAKDYIN